MDLLQQPEKAEEFSNRVVELVANKMGTTWGTSDLTKCVAELDFTCHVDLNDILVEAVHTSACEQLPVVPKKACKPWLSKQAYDLIGRRVCASSNQDYSGVAELTHQLKRQVKLDKTLWLNKLASTGTWEHGTTCGNC